MAAIFAATAGAEVVLVERTRDGGRKILISGGGRCNVLPLRVDESRFVTDSSPNLLRKFVRAWPLAEQRAFFEDTLGIPLEEETESLKLFPASHKARDVRDGLMSYARAVGVQLRMETRVTDIAPTDTGWSVSLDNDVPLTADAVIVATGGLSARTPAATARACRCWPVWDTRCIPPTRRSRRSPRTHPRSTNCRASR